MRETDKQVALLFKDLEVAKTVSSIFRQIGIIPQVYTSLNEFWIASLDKCPDFTLADVQLISEGQRLLKNHPLVLSGELQLSFFWEKSTSPLLVSTFDTFHHGLVCKELPIKGQIKALLRRYNEWLTLSAQKQSQENIKKSTDNKINKIVHVTEALKEKEFYFNLLKSYIARFEERRSALSFEQACSDVFTSIAEVQEFSIFELNKTGQKLSSSLVDSKKYHSVPSLWLGKTCDFGIEFFAQNMASQVCLDLMGGNLMSLSIRGNQQHPERFIVLKLKNEDLLNNIEWNVFENFLSGFYSSFKLKQVVATEALNSQKVTPWQFCSILDQSLNGKINNLEGDIASDRWVLVDINFSDLVHESQLKKLRFYWEEFVNDFLTGIIKSYDYDFKVSFFGISHMVFLVDTHDSGEFFDSLRSYSVRYPYWRFFEEVETILGAKLNPEVKMVPSSIQAYLSFLEEDELDVEIPESSYIPSRRAIEQSM